MQKKASVMDSLNELGLSLYIITIGSIGYLITKGIKKMVDILAESLLQKYIESIRNEVDAYLTPLNKRIDDMDDKIERIRKHESNNALYSEKLLKVLGLDKKLKDAEKND